MTTKGSCLCGAVAFEFTGPPEATALCHCTDCQKWSGSAFTSNVVVRRANMKITKGNTPVIGPLKSYDVIGDSGKINKHHFCSNCGSSLYTELEIMPDVTCIKAGGLDGGKTDLSKEAKGLEIEYYTKDRVGYLQEVEGAKQVKVFGNNGIV